MKQHAKQARAKGSAGKEKNQTSNPALEFQSQSVLVMDTIDKEIERGRGQETAAWLWNLSQQVDCLIRIGARLGRITERPFNYQELKGKFRLDEKIMSLAGDMEEEAQKAESEEARKRLTQVSYRMRQFAEFFLCLPLSQLPPLRPGQPKPMEEAAHDELRRACLEAGDLLYMMALPLSGYMEETAGEGNGTQALADKAGRRLMECLRAANDENKRNGGGQ